MCRHSLPAKLLRRLEALFLDDSAQINLECRDGRWRIRYREADTSAPGKRRRRSITLPDDAILLAMVKERIQKRRNGGKRAVEGRKALLRLKRRVLEASGRGRWLRRRIGRVFDLAVSLGAEMVDDYLAHKPWLATGRPAGRPRKKSATGDDWGQNDGFGRYF